jgi:O-antigen/teichoic acid export membrane protein
VVPTLVAVVAVPITVRGLGDDGYGIVALVGAVSGYLAITQAGFGSAIVRFISQFVTRGEGRAIRECLTEVLSWFSIAGIVGGVAMWALAPWLVNSVLKVPTALTAEAIDAFRIGGVTFAAGALVAPLSLLPNAFLRYDLVATLQSGMAALSLGGPALLVSLGFGLIPVMWFGAALNSVAALVYAVVGARLVRTVPKQGAPFKQHRRGFASFVATEATNQVWCLIQAQTNKVLVGVAGGTSQVAYFQVSTTVADRSNGLLNNMARVLLPTVSQLTAGGSHELIAELYERSTRLLFLLNASITGAVVVFSAPLLGSWIGPRYATQGGTALALLMLAQLVGSMSQVGGNVNLALGRPRINLAFSVINSIVNLGTVYWLTVAYGINGTAASVLLAAFVMPGFVHYTNRKVLGVASWPMFVDCYLRTTLLATIVAVAAWVLLRPLASNLLMTVGLIGFTTIVGLALGAAAGVATPADRASVIAILRRLLPGDRSRAEGGGGGADA